MVIIYEDIIERLRELSNPNPKDLAGMARFGINVENAWVISMPELRKYGKEIIKKVQDENVRHNLALQVWDSKIHEARILAALIDVPTLVTEDQMERWVSNFDSWDICDQVCSNLFDKTEFAYKKVTEWSKRQEVFVRRAGFVLMAALAVHDKKAADSSFIDFLEIIKSEAADSRNFVRKAISWALRQIGKSRTKNLYDLSLKTAKDILNQTQNDKSEDAKAARWVANDTIRELEKSYIKNRFL